MADQLHALFYAPQGVTLQERYVHYRHSSLTIWVFWFTIFCAYQVFTLNTTAPQAVINLHILRISLWIMASLSLMVLFKLAPQITVRFNVTEEEFKRQSLIIVWSYFLLPAVVCSFISIRLILGLNPVGNDDSDFADDIPAFTNLTLATLALYDSNTRRAVMSILVYITATGLGIMAGALTLPTALRAVKAPDFRNIFWQTTMIGFGNRFISSMFLAQVYAFIDSWALFYAGALNLLYLLYAYSEYQKDTPLRAAAYAIHVFIFVLIYLRFTFLPTALIEFIIELLVRYLKFILESFIMTLIYGYFTSRLTRLVLLTRFVPELPEQSVELTTFTQ